jgi:drug/metabolite transporter (DMT)-like permease
MKQQRRAYLFALLAILCWSTIGSAFKLSLRYLDYLDLLLYSSFVATIVLATTLILQGKTSLLKQLDGRDFIRSAGMGLLNPFLYYVVLLKAYELLPAQEAGTLNYIWPLVLVLISIPMLHQRISKWSFLAVLISFSGIILISTHGQLLSMKFSSPLGVMLALGSAIFWAFYWIFNMKDKREAVTKLFLNFCFGFLYILVTVSIIKGIKIPTWPGLAGSVYLGFFEMGIPFVLWLHALKLSSTTAKVTNLIYLSPFISLVIIHFAVGETILFSTVSGLFLIVSGIIMQQYLKS